MAVNRGRGSRFQVWVVVPVTGLAVGAGLAVLAAQGLDQARATATRPEPQVAAPSSAGPTDDVPLRGSPARTASLVPSPLLRPLASVTEVEPGQTLSVMARTVLDSIAPSAPATDTGGAAPDPGVLAPAPAAGIAPQPPAPPAPPSGAVEPVPGPPATDVPPGQADGEPAPAPTDPPATPPADPPAESPGEDPAPAPEDPSAGADPPAPDGSATDSEQAAATAEGTAPAAGPVP